MGDVQSTGGKPLWWIFFQIGVDATHIKLVEGPFRASTLSLGKIVGGISVDIRGETLRINGRKGSEVPSHGGLLV